MVASDGNTKEEMIRNFKMEFESKKKECAVLIVRATSDSEKWTIAGFSDAGEFRTVDPSHELSQELKKEPINESRIIELATSNLGRTLNTKEWIDPHYDHIDFNFKINCPSELDCKAEDICPPETRQEPEINYLAKDYASFRQLILDRLALVMPEWRERHVPDLGIMLVEVLAYVGDYLSYYQDAVATEAYLDTARQRISVRRHARLVDYLIHEGCNARAWVCVQVSITVKLDPKDVLFVTRLDDVLLAGKRLLSLDELRNVPAHTYVAFEPLVTDRNQLLEFHSAHNTIHFYTWGENECCLPKGATSATLLDDWIKPETQPEPQQLPKATQDEQIEAQEKQKRERKLALKKGDVLIFEEVIGPKTGNDADADPTHRHAVRLTKVEPILDSLENTPIVEIEWSPEDALPFPLCLSAVTDAEHGCVYREDISVAHGNVVLVDHGRRIDAPEDLGIVPTAYTQAACDCAGHTGDVTQMAGRFQPQLAQSPLTFSQLVDFNGPASQALQQDPHKAIPQVKLTSLPGGDEWTPHFDLLGSGRDDRDFVAEIDNEGRANLRFGDDACGRAPEAGMQFSAEYRVGNGKVGNVGREAIHHLVYRRNKPDGIDDVRNPLPAGGGADPEPISEVKLFAPSVFRKQLQRAITPEDYARIAERNPKVQRAAAMLCWTGSWYEMQVAIDPVGSEELKDKLRLEIEQDLYRFRRIGYDLRVMPARYVSLDIAMDVCVQPDYLRGHVKAALLRVFSNRILPNGKRGFFHPDNLTFGDGIYLSQIVAAAQVVEGVESVCVPRLQRQFEPPNHELENGVLPLGPLEVARCDNDPTFPEHGRFELNM
jgi:hypothetical protein